MGESGHLVWPSPTERIWELGWSLPNGPDQEGLVISHARGDVFARINGGHFNHCAGGSQDHAYFRFDLDIDTAGNNLALEYDEVAFDAGWGRGWHPIAHERSSVLNRDLHRSWLVLNKTSRRGYHIVPPGSGGPAGAFANRDVWIVRYHGLEDSHGHMGSAWADDLQTSVDARPSTDGMW